MGERGEIAYALSSRVDIRTLDDDDVISIVTAEIAVMLQLAKADLSGTPTRFSIEVDPVGGQLLRVFLEVPARG